MAADEPDTASDPAGDTDSEPPASLTEWLRRRTDEQLAALFRRRPDLALPAPSDTATLASRAGVRSSAQRALDTLDRYTLGVLEAVLISSGAVSGAASDGGREAAAPSTNAEAVAARLDRTDPRPGLATLRDLALVWGDDDSIHLVGAVATALGTYPAGLGRPMADLLRFVPDLLLARVMQNLGLGPARQPAAGQIVAERLGDPATLAGVLQECGPTEREVLSRLADGPPVGVVRNALVPADITDAASAPHRLIARGLLAPIDAQTVELPREVGLAVRGGFVARNLSPSAPPVPVADLGVAELDGRAGTAVLETLRLVEQLGRQWTRHPPALLRSGGIGARELRRTARDLDLNEATTALIIEVAAAAGLIGTTKALSPVYLPTTEFDHWAARAPARRWSDLASAWLSMTRQPGVVNQRDDRDRLISALGPEAERGTIVATRRASLAILAELAPGSAPVSVDDVLARLTWRAPRRAASQHPAAASVLGEAETLGLTAAGGLTTHGRAILDGATATAAAALAAALPEPIDEFLLQPDLTAVVPGPPSPALAQMLDEAANLESTGGASVYRITEATLRRALDGGRTSAELAEFFRSKSRTPIPQALSYLLEDITRRHGVLRTGVASSYLRCDDETLLTRVLFDPNVAPLRLHRIAPTVLVSGAPVAEVLDVLREVGYAPSGEAADGAVLSVPREEPRAPARPARSASRVRSRSQSDAQLDELVQRLRVGDSLAQVSRRVQAAARIPGVTTAATMELLRNAIRADAAIWLGYVDSHGAATQHILTPISMAAGTLRGYDTSTGLLEAFQLHHITAVGLVED